ncbi:hypothetical protein GCM10010116_32950 [Microbispora rosea subsp. aerata]|nr:DUF4190 domain-containing protein [Microbispora rosea]GGO16311.1 hypothetical protein GCM10010116_32950 [Microbispora rosea subsp. aerata]GIH55898.1 hypothetical protein Mro02_28120 [Microbispora rosea subsp. aerata]GLJ83188.1 hypothetical protein GCM10017588_19150 [Microbispora rosea subsp. aerata]
MATPDDPGHPREPYGPGAPQEREPYGGPPYGQPPYGQPPSSQPPYGGPLPPPPGAGGPPGGPWGRQPSGALGTAALVLGICSIVLLLVCGIGTLVALVGLVLGIVAIAKNSNRTKALVGVVLSGLTLLFAVIMSVVIYNWFQTKHVGECFDPRLYPTQEDAQRCVQDKLAGVP